MDLRRGLQHEYGRSRGGDGGGYGALPSSSGRPIPPTGVPSLSTGQGFYTVESLQGATMVPPPQPAPPPPRLLPPREPYVRDLPPPRLHPAERGDLGLFDRRYPPPPAVGRKMMMMAPPDMRMPRREGPGMIHHRPPPPRAFMGDPRMPEFLPGRRNLHRGWGPGDFERGAFDRSRDRTRPSQRTKDKKQGQKTDKPVSRAKSPSKVVAADKKTSTDKKNTVEGGPGWCDLCKIDCSHADSLKKHIAGKRHKKQVESQMQVDNSSDKTEEEGAAATASAEAAGQSKVTDNEQGETIASKEGEMDSKSAETIVVEAPKGEGNSQTSEPKPIAGKKRVLKDAVTPKKKPRKASVSDVKGSEDVANAVATAVKGSEDVTNAEVINLKLKSDVKELPTSDNQPLEESKKEGVDGEKEVSVVINLENGRAGQSAEIQ